MPKILEGLAYMFSQNIIRKKHILGKVQFKNGFLTGVGFNTKQHSRNKCT